MCLTVVVVTGPDVFIIIHRAVHPKRVTFTVYKLSLSKPDPQKRIHTTILIFVKLLITLVFMILIKKYLSRIVLNLLDSISGYES